MFLPWRKVEEEQAVQEPQKQKCKEPRTGCIQSYWIGNSETTLYNFLKEAVHRQYDFCSPVYHGKVHYIENGTDEFCGYYPQSRYEITGCTDVEEITGDTLFNAIKATYCWIDSEEELSSIKSVPYYYGTFVPQKIVKMLEGKYSEAFSLLLADNSKYSRDLIELALALYDEGLSPDMRAYLLLTNNEKKRTG